MDLYAGRRRRAWNLEPETDVCRLASGADTAARNLPGQCRSARQGAMPHEGGANLAVGTFDGIELVSNHLQGTTDWQTLSFFLIEDRWGDTTELACQLAARGIRIRARVLSQYQSGSKSRGSAAARHGQTRSQRDSQRTRTRWIGRMSESRFASVGVVSGLILLGLLGWAIAEISRPALGQGRGLEARGRPESRDHRRQVHRAVSFHRLLLGHLCEKQSRFAGRRAGALENLRSRPAG